MQDNQKNFVDLFSLMLHASVAEKLRLNPNKVLQIARQNLNRWLKNENPALSEWQEILETRTPEEIIKIITQDTDEGQRLRSSSPFVGVLSETERNKIWSDCAKIRPI
ncbi:MAG TPA: hypothetical protein PKY82_08765 [Pyrinomonadaceae bacterium]|nr:hypothetical protein [Pyrinomonadaceae bacterium]